MRTERLGSGNANSDTDTLQPEVIHTVYEPGSFTPLIQLRRVAKTEPDLADELIAHMQPGIAQDALRGMFQDIGATNALVNAGLGNLGMAADAQDFIREQLKGFEQTVNSQREESAKSVEVRHYLCDHLGTPNALVNGRGQIEWAATLDAWGNINAEHNPKRLYQPIRLQGQNQDLETELCYNRYRYFDSVNGCFINQDPIGLEGGMNQSTYAFNRPQSITDPVGLSPLTPASPNIGDAPGAKKPSTCIGTNCQKPPYSANPDGSGVEVEGRPKNPKDWKKSQSQCHALVEKTTGCSCADLSTTFIDCMACASTLSGAARSVGGLGAAAGSIPKEQCYQKYGMT